MTYLNANADMQIRDSLAASTTDLIQSVIMTVAFISIVIFGINAAGGMGNVIDNENSLEGHFSLCHIHNTETLGATFGPVMMSALFWKRSNKYGAVAGLIVRAFFNGLHLEVCCRDGRSAWY